MRFFLKTKTANALFSARAFRWMNLDELERQIDLPCIAIDVNGIVVSVIRRLVLVSLQSLLNI